MTLDDQDTLFDCQCYLVYTCLLFFLLFFLFVDSGAEFPLYIAVNMALTSVDISLGDRNDDSG